MPTHLPFQNIIESDPLIAAPGEVIDGRYRVRELLGRGASAQVFLAEDAHIAGHLVALKLMREPVSNAAAARALQRELEILASVWHPSVVQLKASGLHGGRVYLTMPFLRGETLWRRVHREGGALAPAEAERVFVALASALSALHAVGIRHQDVKPQNIWLAQVLGRPEALPMHLDLGVATRQGEFLTAGTPTYMAPEVARSFIRQDARGEATAKADVYSLALALVEALAPDAFGTLFGTGAPFDVFLAGRAAGVLPRWTDPRLRELAPHLNRWLAVNPDARPDADGFARELGALTAPAARRARRVWFAQRVGVPATLALALLGGAVHHAFDAQAQTMAHQEGVLHDVRASKEELRDTLRACISARSGAEEHLHMEEGIAATCAGQRSRLEGDLARESEALRAAHRSLGRSADDLLGCRDDLAHQVDTAQTCAGERGQAQAGLANCQQQASALGGQAQRCAGELESARAEGTSCGTNLTAARDSLSTCAAAREQSEQQEGVCQGQLASARHDGEACDARLSAARAELATHRPTQVSQTGSEPAAPGGGASAAPADEVTPTT